MKYYLLKIFMWIKSFFSKSDEASILRLGFVWMLIIITYLSIFYLIFSANSKIWNIDIAIIKDISTTIISIVGIIFAGKVSQKVVENIKDQK